MQRWEYRVVSLREGTYTTSLNDYGQAGWELISVVPDVPSPPDTGGRVPVPGALGRLGDAAAKLNQLGESGAAETTPLLWVLRRPLDDD